MSRWVCLAGALRSGGCRSGFCVLMLHGGPRLSGLGKEKSSSKVWSSGISGTFVQTGKWGQTNRSAPHPADNERGLGGAIRRP